LLDILTIALVASVCGAEGCVDFAEFAEDREALLRDFLSMENGLPSHDTFSRVFRLLDPEAFGRAFEAFLDDVGAERAGVLAIDGKTLRRSFDRAAGRSALHLVTAFGTGARVAIGQEAVAEGENEILAARALLETLALGGLLVTGDALHAQTETAAQVLAKGGDYLFALKDNRPAVLAEVAAFFESPPEPLPVFVTTDADHGCVELLRHWVSHDVGWLFSDRRYAGEPRARPRHNRPRRGRANRRWPHQPRRATLRQLRPPPAGAVRRSSPRPLGDREQPALGARRHLRRGPCPQPKGQRPGEPPHPAQVDP
jgi:hypothetical protein